MSTVDFEQQMEQETSNLLFVYGTLMRGMDNPFSNQLSMASQFLGSATAPGCLYDYQGEYPCAVSSSHPGEMIHGELYRLIDPESLFQELDPYEDCHPEDEKRSLFTRRIVDITTHEQNQVKAWMYFWNKPLDGLTLIENGNYRSL